MASLVRVWVSFGESGPAVVHELQDQPVVIGREASCGIFINDASVSRNHASIAFENGQHVLRDHGSVNGTFVNGEAVRSHFLKEGDTIRFGEIVYLYQESNQGLETPLVPETQKSPEEATSPQPLQQIPVPPAQNKPVKVIIGGKQKPQNQHQETHITSRTIPISKEATASLTQSLPQIENKDRAKDYSFLSYVCGCAGSIAFLPAIYYGHLANPTTKEEESQQNTGLFWGYTFLALWLIGAAFLLIYGDKIKNLTQPLKIASVLEVPRIEDGIRMIQEKLMWSPTRKQIQLFLENVPLEAREKRSFMQLYGDARYHWEKGLIVYSPEILRVIPAMSAKDHLKFVIEDFLTNPTFMEYNSTVVPEKKDPISHFLIPSLSSQMVFGRDQNLRAKIDRFNEDEFPWRNAYRAISWTGKKFDYNASQIPELRLMIILKPGINPYTFSIETREGNLNNDYNQTYKLKYYPAEYLAIIAYVEKTEEVLGIQTNPALFSKVNEDRFFKAMISYYFPKILSMRPADENSIPSTFNLGSIHPAQAHYDQNDLRKKFEETDSP